MSLRSKLQADALLQPGILSPPFPPAAAPQTFASTQPYHGVGQRNWCPLQSVLLVSGECISVYYLAEPASLDGDSDFLTLLDRDLELVVMFVRWTAYQELAMTESANPDPTNLAMGTLELNAYRAKRKYRIKLEDYKRAMGESATARWRMDKWDRAY